MKWVTTERAKVDGIARLWLISRFIDPKAVFLFVAPQKVNQNVGRDCRAGLGVGAGLEHSAR